MKKNMRSGFTTGSCAAAGTKAALLAIQGQMVTMVEVVSPQGERIPVPVQALRRITGGAEATIIKDAGDDPDITNGAAIIVAAEVLPESSKIQIAAGAGVGIVTKPGLSVPVGQPAINPGPQTMIRAAIREVLGEDTGCKVTISIPGGELLAKRTLNPTLGIVGGLSIIGTSGIVRPMSEEGFKNSLSPQIRVAKALGYDTIVLVPGKIGERAAVDRYGLPQESVVQTSNFIGHMLETAVEEKIKQVLLFGHLGKMVKVAAGIFHTHNRMADARMETLAAYSALCGAPQAAVGEILGCLTTEAAMAVISFYGLQAVYRQLADRASCRARRYVFDDMAVGTVLVTLRGEILGMDDSAKKIGGDLGWNIKLS